MPKTLTPLDKQPLLLHTVQDRVKEFIVANKLRGGDPLPPEGALAQQLGVSRNSFREAIKGLESLGVVETRRGIGVFVAEFSFGPLLDHLPFGFGDSLRDIEEFLDIRKTLEIALIERVVVKISDELIAGLDALVTGMRNKAEQGQSFPEEDQLFHRTLFSCIENRVLDRLIDVFWLAFHKSARYFDPGNHDPMATYKDHAAIVEAIRRRDIASAREAMAVHYRGISNAIDGSKARQTDGNGKGEANR